MIVRKWPRWFWDLFGGTWPKNYLCVDVETTGFSMKKDVIVEIGHCLVSDGKVEDRLDVVLDWSKHPVIPAEYVRSKLEQVRTSMAKDGRNWGMNWRRMRSEGIEPEKALKFYHTLLNDWAGSGGLFVTHNGFFDEDMLAYNFAGFKIDPNGFDFPEDGYFDTSSIERCNQVSDELDALPVQGENLKAYFKRTQHLRGGKLQSNLDRHCAGKYGLAEKHGLDMSQCHSASFDALLCHCLMIEFGKDADAVPVHTDSKLPELFRQTKQSGPVMELAAPVMYRRTRKRGQRNR